MVEKIVIGRYGIPLEEIVVNTILVFEKGREERVIKVDTKKNLLYTERKFLTEKDDTWYKTFKYYGIKMVYAHFEGQLCKTEDSLRKIRSDMNYIPREGI